VAKRSSIAESELEAWLYIHGKTVQAGSVELIEKTMQWDSIIQQ
jgi:hypothetical protein